MSKQPTGVPDEKASDMAVFTSIPHIYVWRHCICWYVRFVRMRLTILCLFVIKLVQTCTVRPPRAVIHTPSLQQKKKLVVLIISIPWACPAAQNRHLSPPPPHQQATNLNQALWKELFGEQINLRWQQTHWGQSGVIFTEGTKTIRFYIVYCWVISSYTLGLVNDSRLFKSSCRGPLITRRAGC